MAPKRATFRGIGIVTCVYVNPDIDKFWVIDHRIYDPQRDGLNKLQHVEQMLENAIIHKKLPFRGVLFDTWKPPSVGHGGPHGLGYAKMELMKQVERYNKIYYCPVQDNRQIESGPLRGHDSGGRNGYARVDQLLWTQEELKHGKQVHIKDFPKGHGP